jgi:hypothetical protein
LITPTALGLATAIIFAAGAEFFEVSFAIFGNIDAFDMRQMP